MRYERPVSKDAGFSVALRSTGRYFAEIPCHTGPQE